jgi:hypothetical protein
MYQAAIPGGWLALIEFTVFRPIRSDDLRTPIRQRTARRTMAAYVIGRQTGARSVKDLVPPASIDPRSKHYAAGAARSEAAQTSSSSRVP